MEQLIFYTNPMSRGRVAHWMLEEVGVPYETKVIDFTKAEHKGPAFTAINPMGKLPVLVHNGTVITELAAIVLYLADAFPKAGLAPDTSDPQRGTYLRWMMFGAGCVEYALTDKALNRPPASRPSALGYGCYEDTLNALEKAIAPGPFVLGEKFSAVDVYLAAQINFGLMFKSLEPRPSFMAYGARCAERPAFKRSVEKCAELEKKLK